MSDLRTLFISQSYTSLIHTSNDGAVPTGSYIELEDGSGNGLGLEVNRDGNFKIQGEVSASSINGIGNVTAYSSSVDNRLDQLESDTGSQDNRLDLLEEFTSSQEVKNDTISSYTSSINEFTQSTDTRLTQLETYTGSQDNRLNLLDAFTSSQEIKNTTLETTTSSLEGRADNLELFTASQETINSGINSFTQSYYTDSASFDTRITTLDTFSSSQDIKNSVLESVTSSLNEFTASQLTINSGYNAYTESTDNRLNTIESETGSYARTDVANNFTGSNNTFPLQFDLRPTNSPASGDPRFRFDSFQNRMQISLVAEDTFFDREIRFYPSASYSPGYPQDSELSLAIKEYEVLAYVNKLGLTSNGSNNLGTFEISGSTDGDSYVTYLGDNKVMEYNWGGDFIIHNNINARGGIDARAKGTFFEGIEILNGFTASLAEGSLFVGDSTGNTKVITSSSLLSDTVTLSDNNTFTGNNTFSGSVFGEVQTLTVASETASMDCSTGNFFTLQLVSGSVIHLSPNNLNPGQTISLRVQQSPSGTGSISFDNNIKFPEFFEYTASAVPNGKDIVTFVSFDNAELNGVSVNNLI